MIYLIALIPPLAVLIVRPQAILISIILTVIAYIPGLIHAIIVINNKKSDQRIEQLAKAMGKNNE